MSHTKIVLSIVGVIVALLIGVALMVVGLALMYSCNVAKINLKGELFTSSIYGEVDEFGYYLPGAYGDFIVDAIKQSSEDESVKAILLEIDSPGGSPVASEEIANALRKTEKPTIAFIRGVGASAAYWAATGADTIIATTNSDVGGIGVMVGYLENVERNEMEGLKYQTVISGKYKLLGDPNVELTEEERKLIQRDVDIVHENFVSTVSTNRNIPLEEVKQIADGSTMLGAMALQHKLIDIVGDSIAVQEYISYLIGEDVEYCYIDDQIF